MHVNLTATSVRKLGDGLGIILTSPEDVDVFVFADLATMREIRDACIVQIAARSAAAGEPMRDVDAEARS